MIKNNGDCFENLLTTYSSPYTATLCFPSKNSSIPTIVTSSPYKLSLSETWLPNIHLNVCLFFAKCYKHPCSKLSQTKLLGFLSKNPALTLAMKYWMLFPALWMLVTMPNTIVVLKVPRSTVGNSVRVARHPESHNGLNTRNLVKHVFSLTCKFCNTS